MTDERARARHARRTMDDLRDGAVRAMYQGLGVVEGDIDGATREFFRRVRAGEMTGPTEEIMREFEESQRLLAAIRARRRG